LRNWSGKPGFLPNAGTVLGRKCAQNREEHVL
jgi:hypothetical protein